jgi:uncharacterized protein
MANNVELVKGMYDAFAKGDIPTVLASFDPQIEWTDAEGFPTAGTFHGPDAVLQNVIMPLGTDWEGFAVRPEEFLDAGEAVVVTGRYSGTYKATSTAMEADFAHVWKFRDGKAVSFKQFADTALVQAAVWGRQFQQRAVPA